jgi:hypothetical protein
MVICGTVRDIHSKWQEAMIVYPWSLVVLGHADNFVFGNAGEHRSYITPLLRI